MYCKIPTILLIIYTSINISLLAQTRRQKDSLEHWLKKDVKKAKELALSLLDEAENKRSLDGLWYLYKSLGLVHYQERKLTLSTRYYEKALAALPDSIKSKAKEIADIKHNIGLNYYTSGNYEKSLKYYMESIAIEENQNNELGLVPSYLNIALVLKNLQQPAKALEYYKKALLLAKKNDKINLIIPVLYNISQFYINQKDFGNALSYADSTLLLSQGANMDLGIARATALKAEIYNKLNRHNEAFNNIEQAEIFFEKLGSKADLINLNIVKARTYESVKNFKDMRLSTLRALKFSEGLEDYIILRSIYLTLYEANKKLNAPTEALEAYERYVMYKDSTFNLEKDKQINEILTAYETEKKESEIKELGQRNKIQTLQINQQFQFIVFFIVLLLLISVVVFSYYRQKRLKLLKDLQVLEQRLLRSQLNPHFIFNALNSIQGFIINHDAQEGSMYLAKFSKLMRQILENSREEFISLEQELDTLENYMSLQKLRFANKFDYELHIDPAIDREDIAIPPMFAQPFIENAIEHGFSGLNTMGKLEVFFQMDKEYIILEILDNGIGIERAQAAKKEQNKNRKSLSLQITEERIEIYKKMSKKKISFNLFDLKNENALLQGTKVLLSLPYKTI
jgi:Histidine kinase/Tetratricopeptide repeat